MPALSPPVSRAFAVATLAGLLACAYLVLVKPMIDERIDQRAQIDGLQAALTRYQRVGQMRASRQAELAELKQRTTSEDGLLRGANETLMAAAIQNRVKALVDAAQGQLKSVQMLPPQADGRLHRITVRSQMAVPLEGMQRVFHDLEEAEPFLFLDNVDIRSHDESRRRGRNDDGMLEVRLDVYGYAQAPE
jgi:general secretion pathway protein M